MNAFRRSLLIAVFSLGILLFFGNGAHAGNIDPRGQGFRYAWSENIGWIDFFNVTVATTSLEGTAYSAGIGTTSMNCLNQGTCAASNYFVANDGNGVLSGWAWNENIGWISFCGNASGPSAWNVASSTWVCPANPTYKVTIDMYGYFYGYAWSGNIGWISFNCTNTSSCGGVAGNWKVRSAWHTPYYNSAYLISAIYDSQVSGGVAYNTLYWKGEAPPHTVVKFQIASSNCPNGGGNPTACGSSDDWPDKFKGPDGSATTYYTVSPYVWIRIDGVPGGNSGCMCPALTNPGCPVAGVACHNNHRYFRYKAFLETYEEDVTPRIDNVIISYSP